MNMKELEALWKEKQAEIDALSIRSGRGSEHEAQRL